jgi:hypothetical protein
MVNKKLLREKICNEIVIKYNIDYLIKFGFKNLGMLMMQRPFISLFKRLYGEQKT